jgi:hypothetical protein
MIKTMWGNVVVSVEGSKVRMSLNGMEVTLDPVDALHVSDSLRTMANRAITPNNGRAKTMGQES